MTLPRYRSIGMSLLSTLAAACNSSGDPASVPDMPPPAVDTPGPSMPTPMGPTTTPPEGPSSPGLPPLTTTPQQIGAATTCELQGLSKPYVYGSKVKSLLTGLGLTAEELARLNMQPDSLRNLIGQWFDSAEADGVLRRFFAFAFQQRTGGEGRIALPVGDPDIWSGRYDNGLKVEDLLLWNMGESFGRTALRIVREDRPFNEVLTTDTHEMTTALLMLYAFFENRFIDDQGNLVVFPRPQMQAITLLRNQADEGPPEARFDPTSPHFLRFYFREFSGLCVPDDVNELEVTFNESSPQDAAAMVFAALTGGPLTYRNGSRVCTRTADIAPPTLSLVDYSDWRTVRLRRSQNDETPTRFYDLQQLRGLTEAITQSDRVGFQTTLGFFNTWPTNEDNQHRVTINQTLIVALGASFDGTIVADFTPTNLDQDHAGPGTACYGCHQTLDPMRDYFRQSFSYSGGYQLDPAAHALDAQFAFRGVRDSTQTGVRGLAQVLARHRDFPAAWVQKICRFANSAPCPDESPLFAQIVTRFRNNSLNFREMVMDLLSSPLVTNADCVDDGTAQQRSITRREQFCIRLANRLDIADICGQDTVEFLQNNDQWNVSQLVQSIPVDGFGRGKIEPVLISDPSLFSVATRAATCRYASHVFIDRYPRANEAETVNILVTQLMGLPQGDPRRAKALLLIGEHLFAYLEAAGNTTPGALDDARRSAFYVACMSPGVAGTGL